LTRGGGETSTPSYTSKGTQVERVKTSNSSALTSEDFTSKALQRAIKTAQFICGAAFPPLQESYNTWVTKRAQNTVRDHTHPQKRLFTFLPSGRCYRSVEARTTRLIPRPSGS